MRQLATFFVSICYVITVFSQTKVSLFQAVTAGNNVVVSWETTSEMQVAYFGIEQLIGNAVYTIGQVMPMGYKDGEMLYNFSDMGGMNVASHCYRIKIVDTNGDFTYITSDSACITTGITNEVPASVSLKRGKMKVSPNPNTQKAAISMAKPGKYTLTIYDLDGKKVGNIYFEGTDYELDISQYLKSTYYIETTDMRNIYIEKITIF